MTRNPFRKALLQRTLTFGTWIQAGNAATAEILANAGYEWIVADCEHSDIDVELFANLARGMHGRGAVPLVRVRENDTLAIRQMLDMGAQGIVVPLVNNAQDAQKAVSAAKYPPLGVRGFCLSRMNNYGADFEEYVQHANDDIAVVVMIESQEAVQNINEILAVAGVDGTLIGPYDLSGSYGIPGQTDHPTVQDACQKVLQASQDAGKAAGLHAVSAYRAAIEDGIANGYTFVAVGMDTVFLSRSAREALDIARAAANQPQPLH